MLPKFGILIAVTTECSSTDKSYSPISYWTDCQSCALAVLMCINPGEEGEDVSSYWMTLRKRKDTGN
jgi:hypothetical protein